MANVPVLPKIDTLTQVWEILTDPAKAAAHLKHIKDAIADHDRKLERYTKIKNIEKAQADADARFAEGARFRVEAAEYFEARKGSADKLHAASEKRAADLNILHQDILKNAEAKAAKLDTWETELEKREENAARLLAEAAHQKEIADRIFSEAKAVKAEYEDKLRKVKELAA